jgi:regulator of RNase E activity RraA
MIGGLRVSPGDLIIGDDDGLCAISPDLIRALIDRAEAKLRLEDEWIAGFKAGKTAAEVFG